MFGGLVWQPSDVISRQLSGLKVLVAVYQMCTVCQLLRCQSSLSQFSPVSLCMSVCLPVCV